MLLPVATTIRYGEHPMSYLCTQCQGVFPASVVRPNGNGLYASAKSLLFAAGTMFIDIAVMFGKAGIG